MNEVPGRRVKLTEEDTSLILAIVRQVVVKVFVAISLAGILGASSLWVTQARQEEANKAVLQKIDYKYEGLKQGQDDASKELKLTISPIDKRVTDLEENQKYWFRNGKKKVGDE